MFLKVRRGSDPVDDGKQSGLGQRCQYTVPDIAPDVDSLTGCCPKCPDIGGCAVLIFGNNHQKCPVCHRDEGLRAVGMPFQHVQHDGKPPYPGLKDRNPGAPVRSEVKPRPVVPAPAKSLIDQPVRGSGRLEHLAKGGESHGCQRFDDNHNVSAGCRFTSL